MSKEYKCASCPMRAKYEKSPRSFVGRFWRCHINFCPGWSGYFHSLTPEEQTALGQKYNLTKQTK